MMRCLSTERRESVMAESHTSDAVVLRWRSYGESDKIVTFLTRDFGKVTGIGKGAKNSRRRFPNSLESLARVVVRFRQRPQASLAFLEGAELRAQPADGIDAERLAYGSYLTELVEHLTVEWSPVHGTFDLLEEALQSLADGPATAAFLRAYELKLLQRAGFNPPLDACPRCDTELITLDEICFVPTQGTFCCPTCDSSGRPTLPVAPSLVERLQSLRALPLQRCRDESLGTDRADAAKVMGELIALHLVRPLQSPRAIAQLTSK